MEGRGTTKIHVWYQRNWSTPYIVRLTYLSSFSCHLCFMMPVPLGLGQCVRGSAPKQNKTILCSQCKLWGTIVPSPPMFSPHGKQLARTYCGTAVQLSPCQGRAVFPRRRTATSLLRSRPYRFYSACIEKWQGPLCARWISRPSGLCRPIKTEDLFADAMDALNPMHDQCFTDALNHSVGLHVDLAHCCEILG